MLERKEYLKELWFTMHHSEKPNTRSLFVRCYLDESGTHDSSPYAVVAGLMIDRDGFLNLDDEWVNLSSKWGLTAPLHMSEFGEHGAHGHFNYEERSKLLMEAVDIINRHKKYSIAATLSRKKYESIILGALQQKFSQYGFCFVLLAYYNHLILEGVKYTENIPYILHHGNPRKGDILHAEEAFLNRRDKFPLHMDSITFKNGDLSTLQAADMVAWGVRRKATNLLFNKGYQPISKLLNWHHEQKDWSDTWLRELSENLLPYVTEDQNKGLVDSDF